MGLRFNKRIKIAKGVTLNLNKKSFGVSIGPRGMKYTINTKGQTTKSVGLPGTGIYYRETKGPPSKTNATPSNPVPKDHFRVGKAMPINIPMAKTFPLGCLVFLALVGFVVVIGNPIIGLAILGITIALSALHFGKKGEACRYYYDAYKIITKKPEKNDEAIKDMRLSAKVDPKNPNTHKALMALYLDAEKYDKSLEHAEKVLKLIPNDPDATAYKNTIQSAINQYLKANPNVVKDIQARGIEVPVNVSGQRQQPEIPTDVPEEQQIAIYLYWSRNGKGSGDPSPQYFLYQFGIRDAATFRKDLISKGLLEPASAKNYLTQMTVEDLKEILSHHGLKKTGRKAELIERIESSLSSEAISTLFPPNMHSLYVPSQSGKDHLKNYGYYAELYKYSNWEISPEEFVSAREKLPFKASFFDVCWGIFNHRKMEYTLSGEYFPLRRNQSHMYDLLMIEGRDEAAYSILLEVFHLELNEPYLNYDREWTMTPPPDEPPFDIDNALIGIKIHIIEGQKFYTSELLEKAYKSFPTIKTRFTLQQEEDILKDLFK